MKNKHDFLIQRLDFKDSQSDRKCTYGIHSFESCVSIFHHLNDSFVSDCNLSTFIDITSNVWFWSNE